jgi:dihydropyrimidinase
MDYDRVIKGGEVVSASGRARADVGITGERIGALGRDLEGRETIDATGLWVLPGVIDAHTHFALPVSGMRTADDFASGTRAAALGGVTTVIDFTTAIDSPSLVDAVVARRAEADPGVCVDYGLHAVCRRWDAAVAAEIPALVRSGVTSLKFFMVYGARGWRVGEADLRAALRESATLGIRVCVHAEDEADIEWRQAQAHRDGRSGAATHAWTRPAITEARAVAQAIDAVTGTGGRLHIVHVSTASAVELITQARGRGVRVCAETCPQYLLLDAVLLDRPDGHLYATCPPLRGAADRARLWEGLAQGEPGIIATDHCAFTRAQKASWGGDYTRIPMGLPGIEVLLPLVHEHGVRRGRIDAGTMIDRLCEEPARRFGLWPRKGTLSAGSDADLVLFDPCREVRITARDLTTPTDYTPYEAMQVTGWPVMTIARGEVIAREGECVGRPGRGRFVPRDPAVE